MSSEPKTRAQFFEKFKENNIYAPVATTLPALKKAWEDFTKDGSVSPPFAKTAAATAAVPVAVPVVEQPPPQEVVAPVTTQKRVVKKKVTEPAAVEPTPAPVEKKVNEYNAFVSQKLKEYKSLNPDSQIVKDYKISHPELTDHKRSFAYAAKCWADQKLAKSGTATAEEPQKATEEVAKPTEVVTETSKKVVKKTKVAPATSEATKTVETVKAPSPKKETPKEPSLETDLDFTLPVDPPLSPRECSQKERGERSRSPSPREHSPRVRSRSPERSFIPGAVYSITSERLGELLKKMNVVIDLHEFYNIYNQSRSNPHRVVNIGCRSNTISIVNEQLDRVVPPSLTSDEFKIFKRTFETCETERSPESLAEKSGLSVTQVADGLINFQKYKLKFNIK